MVFSFNHQVAPKAQAIACGACHDPKGVMDFKALGYTEAKVKELSSTR